MPPRSSGTKPSQTRKTDPNASVKTKRKLFNQIQLAIKTKPFSSKSAQFNRCCSVYECLVSVSEISDLRALQTSIYSQPASDLR